MSDLTPKRTALYRKLADLVEEFSRCDTEEDGDHPMMPTGWCLIIGFEGVDESLADPMASTVGVYPKDGNQANWKTDGMLSQAKSYYAYRPSE